MLFDSSFKIRTFHTDGFGHVNNARYLELLEEARWQYAEAIGLIQLLEEKNLGFIIIDMHLRFRIPVVEGESIQVQTSLVSLGTAGGEVRQTVTKKDSSKIALKSLFHFILLDRQTGKSIPIEGEIRKTLLGVLESGRPTKK